jgi:lipopolysaccharide transport system ATP-binding protein
MYVRLAFAVAAHLEPEILLVDEVLAVGDAEFQKRCLGKMDEVARGGRTILFVSHNMGAIQRLCPSTIWIDGGRIRAAGMTSGIVGAYLKAGHLGRGTAEMVFPEMPAKGAQLRKARVLSQNGSVRQLLSCDEPIVLDLLFHVNVRIPGLYGYMEISRGDGTRLLVSYSHDHMPDPLDGLTPGMYSFRVTIPPRVLGPGAYTVYLSFTSRQSMHFEVDSPGVVCGFAVQDSMTKSGNNRPGMLSVLLPWDVKEVSEEAAA